MGSASPSWYLAWDQDCWLAVQRPSSCPAAGWCWTILIVAQDYHMLKTKSTCSSPSSWRDLGSPRGEPIVDGYPWWWHCQSVETSCLLLWGCQETVWNLASRVVGIHPLSNQSKDVLSTCCHSSRWGTGETPRWVWLAQCLVWTGHPMLSHHRWSWMPHLLPCLAIQHSCQPCCLLSIDVFLVFACRISKRRQKKSSRFVNPCWHVHCSSRSCCASKMLNSEFQNFKHMLACTKADIMLSKTIVFSQTSSIIVYTMLKREGEKTKV